MKRFLLPVFLCRKDPDDWITAKFCSHDGCPEEIGTDLKNYWTTAEQVAIIFSNKLAVAELGLRTENIRFHSDLNRNPMPAGRHSDMTAFRQAVVNYSSRAAYVYYYPGNGSRHWYRIDLISHTLEVLR